MSNNGESLWAKDVQALISIWRRGSHSEGAAVSYAFFFPFSVWQEVRYDTHYTLLNT